jgi:hypothetical protein
MSDNPLTELTKPHVQWRRISDHDAGFGWSTWEVNGARILVGPGLRKGKRPHTDKEENDRVIRIAFTHPKARGRV